MLVKSLVFFFSLITSIAFAFSSDDLEIAEVMEELGVQGTVVLSSDNDITTYVYNFERAHTPLCPASTFKIPNSIIALEEGVIADQDEIIPWDGQKHIFEAWNCDHNLKSAYQSSCVWFYQELAKRIGNRAYIDTLQSWGYGNGRTGNELTTFWLAGKGDLRISPYEQIDFLKMVYRRQLPISPRTYTILDEIMFEKETETYQIYSKTGSATQDWVGHAWYVGYVKKGDETWYFATNIIINGLKDIPKRKEVVLAALKRKGILE